MDTLATILAFTGLVFYLGIFVFYNKRILQGRMEVNTSTWLIWCGLALLITFSYSRMTGDWVKSLQIYGSGIAHLATFLIAVRHEKLSRLTIDEWIVVGACIATTLVWQTSHNDTAANLMFLACLNLSIAPTYKDAWRKPRGQDPLPWFLFGGSYCFTLAVNLLRWTGKPAELGLPIDAGLVQVILGVLIVYRRRKIRGPAT